MNNKPDQDDGSEQLDELLVAYLDGELTQQQRSDLERQLGRDQMLRNRLRGLQTSWDLLDELPLATPSPQLLESTIRMAIASATDTPGLTPQFLSDCQDATTAGGPDNDPAASHTSTARPAGRSGWTDLTPDNGAAASHAATHRTAAPAHWRPPHWWPKHWWSRPLLRTALLTIACVAIGAAVSRGWQAWQFRQQLKQLPVAMHLDAYLNASDLALMRTLINLPQWQKTVEIAERFGEWDFQLQQQIDEAAVAERANVLQQLPIEHQQVVLQAWQQFEQLDAPRKSEALQVAKRVQQQSDSTELLQTMDRFARWRESLAPSQRDQISSGSAESRVQALEAALQRTVRQWTQQTARLLTDEDTETIYQELRQIAKLRIDQLEPTANLGVLQAFGSQHQRMDPRMEAFFLRRLFEGSDPGPAGPTGPATGDDHRGPENRGAEDSGPEDNERANNERANNARTNNSRTNNARTNSGPPPGGPAPGGGRLPAPVRFDFMAPALGPLRPAIEHLSGPLQDEELWMIKQQLGGDLQAFLDAAATIDSLQADLLKSWSEESLRRMASTRSGSTYSERYQRLDPGRRDLLDLLPPDQILDSLRDDWRRR